MNKKNSDLVINNYKDFCQLEGSDYIASEFALETIITLLNVFKVKSVLEIGLGIGCVSDTIMKYSKLNNLKIDYFGTESNEYCLSVLPKNVKGFSELKLYYELSEIQKNNFDLIIIDGSDDSLKNITKYVNKSTILYIEGDRKEQTQIIRSLFKKHCYVNVITLKKNPKYAHEGRSVNSYIGGGQLIFINPNIKMKLFYFNEKIKTFFKNKIRKMNSLK